MEEIIETLERNEETIKKQQQIITRLSKLLLNYMNMEEIERVCAGE